MFVDRRPHSRTSPIVSTSIPPEPHAGSSIRLALLWFQASLTSNLDHRSRSEELAGFLARSVGELTQEVLVSSSEHIVRD